jgi:Ni/Fe-hydrogenase subunit HybB-like protein
MTHEIVDPEPHSKPKFGAGWEYIPRWLRIVLCVIVVAVMVLILYLTR